MSVMNVTMLISYALLAAFGVGEIKRRSALLRGDDASAERIEFSTGWCIGVACIVLSVGLNISGAHVSAGMNAVVGALSLWSWWNKSKRHRKRLAEKVTGVVANLGHRLTVVQVPAGGESR